MFLSTLAVAQGSLAAPNLQTGVIPRQWLTEHTKPNEVVIASNGQSVHYLLDRPVVTIIDPHVSSRAQDENGIHEIMRGFPAHYLVLFKGKGLAGAAEQTEIPFLQGLVSGSAPPEWLHGVLEGPDTLVFECADCVVR